MDPIDPNDPRVPKRPLWGLFLLMLPAAGVLGLLTAYAGMWGLGLRGRAPEGATAHLTFVGCAEAGPVVEARLRDMGLPATRGSTPDGFTFDLVLPADPRAAARIPSTLAVPGVLEIRGGDQPLATSADVTDASVRMDLMMTPSALVKVGPAAADRVTAYVRAHREGVLDFWLDGVRIGSQNNQDPVAKGELELSPVAPMDEQTRWDAVAEWSVVIDHPLPCGISGAKEAEAR